METALNPQSRRLSSPFSLSLKLPQLWQISWVQSVWMRSLFFMVPYDGMRPRQSWSASHPIGAVTTMLRRHEITDQQWMAIRDLLPGQEGDPGVTAKDNRLFINAIMWFAKTGAPWRDFPERFGPWKTIHSRFSRWNTRGIFQKVLDEFKKDADHESNMADGSYAKAHQDAAGNDQEPPACGADALERDFGAAVTFS